MTTTENTTNTTIRVLKKPGNKLCVLQLNTSENILNDYHRKTHFIFAMDISASMDEPAIVPETSEYVSPKNTRLNYITRVLGGCLAFILETSSSDDFNDIVISVMTFSTKAKTIVRQQSANFFSNGNVKRLITNVKKQSRQATNFEGAMKHIAFNISLLNTEVESNPINEIVVFLTDGCITEGISDYSELAKIMCNRRQHVADWRFIGVGVDFDYRLITSIKQIVTKRQTDLRNTPAITVDLLDNMDHASIIYADIISPYTSNSVYNSRFFSLDSDGYAPVYFGNPITCHLDSKHFILGIVPAGTTRYVCVKSSDELAFAVGYSDSKFHSCHGPATNELVITSESFINIEEGSEDSLIYNVMILRQECMETVGTCYSIIDSIECYQPQTNNQIFSTPLTLRAKSSINLQLNDVDNSTDLNLESMTTDEKESNSSSTKQVESHKVQMVSMQQKVSDFLAKTKNQSMPILLAQILNQCIDDISFAISAIDRVIVSGDITLSKMVIGSRLNSQQYQRAYTITNTSILENSSPYYNNINSSISLTNNNAYTPYTPSVTRTISQVINTQSKLY